MLRQLDADRVKLAEADVHVLLHLHLLLIEVVVLAATAILTVPGSEFENAVALDAEGGPFPVSTTCPTEKAALSQL